MRGVRAVVAAVALVLGAGGCSAEPEAAPAPSSSASSTSEAPVVEPSPTTEAFTKPVLPQAATTPDAAGAEAFVHYWYELVNYAYASGDVDAALELSHVDCRGCAGLQETVTSATATGGVWQDVDFVPEQLETQAPDSDGISVITGLVVQQGDPSVRELNGSVVEATGIEVESIRFWAQWTGDHWQAFEYGYPDRQS